MILFFFTFISITFSQNTNSERNETCFLIGKSFILNEENTIMKINGKGKMCDCDNPMHYREFEEIADKIDRIIIGNSVKRIGNGCMSIFTNIKSIELGKGVEIIGKKAFQKTHIKRLKIPKSVMKIESETFSECDELEEVIFDEIDINNLKKDDNTQSWFSNENNEKIKEIEIENKAFFGCTKLVKFHIPRRLRKFEWSIFDGCNLLRSLIVNEDNDLFEMYDTVLFDTNGTRIIYNPLIMNPQIDTNNNINQNEINPNIQKLQNIEEQQKQMNQQIQIPINENIKQVSKKMNDNSQRLSNLRRIKRSEVPEHIQTEVVTIHHCDLIELYAFAFNTHIRTVVIITPKIEIQQNAFAGCPNLSTVIIASEDVTLGEDVFEGCPKLKRINVTENLMETLDINGLQNVPIKLKGSCGTMCNYYIDEERGEMYISGKGKLAKFDSNLTDQIKYSIQTVRIFQDITTINDNAFNMFVHMKSIEIPQTVMIIGVNPFIGCSELYHIGLFGNNHFVFENGMLMTSDREEIITYLKTTTTVNVTLPQTIQKLRDFAFYGNKHIQSLELKSSISTIGINPFIDCINLKTIKFQSNKYFKFELGMILTSDELEIISYLPSSTETDFIFLPDDLEIIRDYAFDGNNYLQLIVIPMNVDVFGSHSFGQCSSLEHVYYLGYTMPMVDVDSFDGTEVSFIKVKNGCGDMVIPGKIVYEMVEEYNGGVNFFFDEITGLLVVYGEGYMLNGTSVTTDSNVFFDTPWLKYNETLKHVIIEYGVKNIGSQVFRSNYHNLKNVRIGYSVQKIEEQAFFECTSLVSIKIPPEVKVLPVSIFFGCISLQKVILPAGLTTIQNFAFANCLSLPTIKIPSNVTFVGDNAFSNCVSLTKFHFPKNARYIGSSIFQGCVSLFKVSLPKKITTIPMYLFNDCKSLVFVTIPQRVNTISAFAFWQCSSLQKITIPDNVTTINEYAFKNCLSLKTVIIGERVETIKKGAFGFCRSLENVVIKSMYLETIELLAFTQCPNLESIVFHGIIPPDCETSVSWDCDGYPFSLYSSETNSCHKLQTVVTVSEDYLSDEFCEMSVSKTLKTT